MVTCRSATMVDYQPASRTMMRHYRPPVKDDEDGQLGMSGAERRHGMYGPPPCCKRKMKMTELVCANVSGLCWSSGDLLA